MNIIEAVKQILNNYPGISAFSGDVHVDFTDSSPTNFGLSPIGDKKIKEDILGNQTRQHSFVLYAINQSYTDYDRLANSTFLLDLSNWLDTVKGQEVEAKIDRQIKTGKITKMSSANGMPFSIPNGDINGGVAYQIQIYAQYTIQN